MGAVGAGAGEHDLVKVIGTSTCDILMFDADQVGDRTIHGICGQVKGSALPGLMALEAGQSAFGDVYAWYKRVLMWPIQALAKTNTDAAKVMEQLDKAMIPMLASSAQQYGFNDNSPLAMDWHNGRRTPYANQRLKGAVTDLNLGSTAPAMFAALVESTAHGAKAMASPISQVYKPNAAAKALREQRYSAYRELGQHLEQISEVKLSQEYSHG